MSEETGFNFDTTLELMLVALSSISENISIVINRQFSMMDEDHCHFSYRHYL